MFTKYRYFILGVSVIIAGAIFLLETQDKQETEEVQESSSVTEVELFALGEGQTVSSFTTYGQVVSVSRVDVYPEIQGVVASVEGSLGDTVNRGEVIVVLQNSAQRQQLASARASLENAQANYELVTSDAEASSIAQLESALAQAESAQASTGQATLRSLDTLYEELLEVVVPRFDQDFYTKTNTDYPQIELKVDTSSREQELQALRVAVGTIENQDKGYQDPEQAIQVLASHVDTVQEMVDEVAVEVSKQTPSASISQKTIDGYGALIAQTNASLSSITSQLTERASSLRQAKQAVQAAEANLEDAQDGARDEEVRIAQSQVAQAQSSLESAQIALEQTRITSPVAGEISNIDVRIGSLVGPQNALFTVANEQTLRIDSKVNAQVAQAIGVGDEVMVDNQYEAVVSAISPSVDTQTGQVDIQVLITDSSVSLTSGVGVELEIFSDRNQSEGYLSVPISALFVRDNQAYVYTIDENNRATPQKVGVTDLFGESIEIESGLQSGDKIILHAREVEDDEEVTVVTQ